MNPAREKSKAVRAYFDTVACDWDRLREGYFTEKVREAALRKGELSRNMVVADVGAGTGFMAAGLASRVNRVICVDASPEMLQVAERNLASFDNLEYRVGDGAALPIADASLDAVFANMYLHHVEEPLAALKEMARVLKPGGRLVITDMERHDNEWMREEMADLWLGFEREQMAEWLEKSGLSGVCVEGSGET